MLVACPENSLLDWKDFYQPVVSLYEVELACNSARQWSSKYITDFRQLLTGKLLTEIYLKVLKILQQNQLCL